MTVEELYKEEIQLLSEYDGKYYAKIDLSSPALWVVDKQTGKVEYMDGLIYAAVDYKDTCHSLGELATELSDPQNIKGFKQFLLSFLDNTK